jgi:GT2 family glycosyltransferase
MESKILVSVVILNYNNKDMLKKSVQSVLSLDWPNLEVIVVDNASSDGSSEMVEVEFGQLVQIIRRKVNSPTAGRNQGFLAAHGEYVLSLDNDIVLPDKSVVRKGISLFSEFPQVGLLAFKIGSVENPSEPLPEHWWYPAPLQVGKNRYFYADTFSEGAAFFRSQLVRDMGGYDEDFFQYWEDVDLALRMIHHGFYVLYCPSLVSAEMKVRGFLHSQRNYSNYLALRNRLWTAWKHFPVWRGLCFFLPRIVAAGLRSVRYKWFGYFLKGLRDGISPPRTIRARRRPLRNEVWSKIDEIHHGKFVKVQSCDHFVKMTTT